MPMPIPIPVGDEQHVRAASLKVEEVEKIEVEEKIEETGVEQQPQMEDEDGEEDQEKQNDNKQAALEKRITTIVEVLAKLDKRLPSPAQPKFDFWGMPKLRHILEALAAFLASGKTATKRNYAVSYVATEQELVILIASDLDVPQEKVEFVDKLVSKGQLLLSKETKEDRKNQPLSGQDLRDPDCIDLFRHMIHYDFKSFHSRVKMYEYILTHLCECCDMLNLLPSTRQTMKQFELVFKATVNNLGIRERHHRDRVTIFENADLVIYWVSAVFDLGDISTSEWAKIDEGAKVYILGVVESEPNPVSQRIKRLTNVFRKAIILESSLRYHRTRQLLNRPCRVVKVDTPPDLCHLPQSQDIQQWSQSLEEMLGPHRPVGLSIVLEKLAHDLSRPRTRRPGIHAELKLLAFFRCTNMWCSRIVLTGRACLACCIILDNELNHKERHRQSFKSRKGFTRDWVIPSGVMSEKTLHNCYEDLTKQLERLSSRKAHEACRRYTRQAHRALPANSKGSSTDTFVP